VWQQRVDDLAPFSRGEGPGERIIVRPRSHARLEQAGVTDGLAIERASPSGCVRRSISARRAQVRKTMRELDLVTVCEDAGCPNLSECWSDGTATFMVLGERCTRACGFCLVDTRKPLPPAIPTRPSGSPRRSTGWGSITPCSPWWPATTSPTAGWRTSPSASGDPPSPSGDAGRDPDLRRKGSLDALELLFAARPDVLNHNIETVARLQRAVRPSAGYARSLSVLAHAKAAGLVTKSSIMVGVGETDDEVVGALADLAGHRVRHRHHRAVPAPDEPPPPGGPLGRAAGVRPLEADRRALGIGHVEAGPLTRSSYHAKQAADRITPVSIS
jgi:lipoyl synthase